MEILSLSLSFVGSILLAFSVIKNPGNAHQRKNNKKIYLASVLLNRFRAGIILLIVGFGLQLLITLNICNDLV